MGLFSPHVRTVLLFGDSNTWGYSPASGERLPRDRRWPGLLEKAVAGEWHVVEEGLRGRTATIDSPTAPGRAGIDYLEPCLDTHSPLDAVVVFLGTNDLNDRYRLMSEDAAIAIARLARLVLRSPEYGVRGEAPRVLLVAPPRFGRIDPAGSYAGAAGKDEALAHHLREQAALLGCAFLDLGEHVRYSDLDTIHLDDEDQPAVARAVEAALRAL
jgi:lysophospholipase L1-like esterase